MPEGNQKSLFEQLSKQKLLQDNLSINDLKDIEFHDEKDLSPQQRLAIKNFERHRITELNKQRSETLFHDKYMQLQAMANLMPYEEFLKEEYFL